MPWPMYLILAVYRRLAMEGDRDRCLAAGANEYICKPIRLETALPFDSYPGTKILQ